MTSSPELTLEVTVKNSDVAMQLVGADKSVEANRAGRGEDGQRRQEDRRVNA